MATKSDSERDQEEMSFNGPGGRLRYLRESKRISLEKAVENLHLSSKRVEDIENDNYSDFGSATFVIGYLRAYAKWIGYSEAEILKEFNDLNLAATIKSSRPSLIKDRDIAPPTRRIRWVTYLVVIGFMVLTAVWWNMRSTSHDKSVGNNAADALPAQPVQSTASVASPNPNNNQPIVQSLPIQSIAPPAEPQAPAPAKESEPPPPKNMQEE